MDVLKLDPTTYLPNYLLQGFDSCIWTERYAEAGEFELNSYDVATQKSALPVDSLITLRDSKEIMLVENHEITTDDDGVDILKTTGRTLESFLEQRVFIGLSDDSLSLPLYLPSQAVAAIVWNAFVNTTDYDIISYTHGKSTRDPIPNLKVSISIPIFTETSDNWEVKPDYVYSYVLEFLGRSDLGIRNIRPKTSTAEVVSVTNTGFFATSGTVSTSTEYNIDEILIDIYRGLDRTQDQDDNTPVVFSYRNNEVSQPQYLFTKKNFKNATYFTSTVADDFYNGDTSTGLKRRVMFSDYGSKYGTNVTKVTNALIQREKAWVKKLKKTLYFDGGASQHSNYKYKIDYDLGDLVTLEGKYNVHQTMRVTEYVRVQDKDGERGYPTLSDDV